MYIWLVSYPICSSLHTTKRSKNPSARIFSHEMSLELECVCVFQVPTFHISSSTRFFPSQQYTYSKAKAVCSSRSKTWWYTNVQWLYTYRFSGAAGRRWASSSRQHLQLVQVPLPSSHLTLYHPWRISPPWFFSAAV